MKAFRITELVHAKATREDKKQGQIRQELCELLGIGLDRMRQIENMRTTDKVSFGRLSAISEYFSCTVDELINPSFREAAAQ